MNLLSRALSTRNTDMNYTPPASVRRVCDPRWRRFIVMDGSGHYWTGTAWSDDPVNAMLYLRESDAMRAGLQLHEGCAARYKATITISVGNGEWKLEDLQKHLKELGRFILMKSQETRAVKVEINWDGLKADDQDVD